MDNGVVAQLRLEKGIQLKDFTAPGIGEIQSTLISAVDNIFLFTNGFDSVLSLDTGSNGDSGASASCRDRFHLIQKDLRSLADKQRACLVRFRVVLTRGQYAYQVDVDKSEAFQAEL